MRASAPRLPVSRQRGVALVAVVWVLTLMAVIASAVTVETRTEMELARNVETLARAEAIAGKQ